MYYCIYTNQPDCDEVCCNPHLGDCTGCDASITANDSTDIAGELYCQSCSDTYESTRNASRVLNASINDLIGTE